MKLRILAVKLSLVFLAGLSLQILLTGRVYAYDCADPNDLALTCLEGVVGNILKGIVSFVGIIAFLFIIKGGLAYTASGGDAKAIDTAKRTITWAAIGLFLAISAFAILNVINTTFGANLLRFAIPPPASP